MKESTRNALLVVGWIVVFLLIPFIMGVHHG